MTIGESWKTAFVTSVVVALIVASIEYFIFSGGTVYVAQVEWDKVDAMLYGEAKTYLAERLDSISNWESVVNGTTYNEFWFRFIHQTLVYFSLAFGSCLCFAWFLQSSKRAERDRENRDPSA